MNTTENNINTVRNQIQMKKGFNPYYSTSEDAGTTITDMDHFPYTRFYRGKYNSNIPIVFEREAGWRPLRQSCYSMNNCKIPEQETPNHCFEGACSVVFPCYPKYLQKFSDRDALNVQLNKSCIVQYR